MNLGASRTKTFPRDSALWLRMVFIANLLHPTLRTKSSSFSFCTKSGKYYDRIDYMYTFHMLNIVNFFFSSPCFASDFVTRDWAPLFYYPPLKHYQTSRAAMSKNKTSTLQTQEEGSSEAGLQEEDVGLYFCLAAVIFLFFFWHCQIHQCRFIFVCLYNSMTSCHLMMCRAAHLL